MSLSPLLDSVPKEYELGNNIVLHVNDSGLLALKYQNPAEETGLKKLTSYTHKLQTIIPHLIAEENPRLKLIGDPIWIKKPVNKGGIPTIFLRHSPRANIPKKRGNLAQLHVKTATGRHLFEAGFLDKRGTFPPFRVLPHTLHKTAEKIKEVGLDTLYRDFKAKEKEAMRMESDARSPVLSPRSIEDADEVSGKEEPTDKPKTIWQVVKDIFKAIAAFFVLVCTFGKVRLFKEEKPRVDQEMPLLQLTLGKRERSENDSSHSSEEEDTGSFVLKELDIKEEGPTTMVIREFGPADDSVLPPGKIA